MRKFTTMFGSALVLGAALVSAQTTSMKPKAGGHTVEMKSGTGASVGTATITAAGSGVSIALDLKGLTAGAHAIHVHQVPKCDGPAFTSAGPHFNPDAKKHGAENPQGPHAGDMNNITVAANGTVKTTVTNTHVNLTTGAGSLVANGGTALVVHAKADDMKTDPAGNAGDRIACGVVTAAAH